MARPGRRSIPRKAALVLRGLRLARMARLAKLMLGRSDGQWILPSPWISLK